VTWSRVDPAGLSLSDSMRALGSYRAETTATEKRIDVLRSGAAQTNIDDLRTSNPLASAKLNAAILIQFLYKARLAPSACLLATSIQSGCTENDHENAKKLAMGIMDLQPRMYNDFKKYADFKYVRQLDWYTLESEIDGKKTPSEVVAWLYTSRRKMADGAEAESSVTGLQGASGITRNFGDILRRGDRPASTKTQKHSQEYIKLLMSCLGSTVPDMTSKSNETPEPSSRIATDLGSDRVGTAGQSDLISSFDPVAVRKFLARDYETDEQGFVIDPIMTSHVVMPEDRETQAYLWAENGSA